MLVKEVMLTKVFSVSRGTTLSQLLKTYGKFHGLPLVPVIDDDKHLVGQVSIKDLVSVFSPRGRDLQRIIDSLPFVEREQEDIFGSDIPPEMGLLVVVDDFMNRQVTSINEKATMQEAYQHLGRLSTEEILVVNDDNKLVGIIGVFDLILAVFRERGIL